MHRKTIEKLPQPCQLRMLKWIPSWIPAKGSMLKLHRALGALCLLDPSPCTLKSFASVLCQRRVQTRRCVKGRAGQMCNAERHGCRFAMAFSRASISKASAGKCHDEPSVTAHEHRAARSSRSCSCGVFKVLQQAKTYSDARCSVQ